MRPESRSASSHASAGPSGTATAAGMLEELGRVIPARARSGDPQSYTARLAAKGPDAALKKIGEEATEVVLAAKGQSDERLAE